jgi:cytochrome c553
LGVAYFCFLAQVTFLTLILTGKEVFGLTGEAIAQSSIFNGLVGIGIAIGSLFVAWVCRKRVVLAAVPVGALGMAAGLAGAALLDPATVPAKAANLTMAAAPYLGSIGAIGFFAAIFLVPLNAFIQDKADPERRGRVTSTVNLLNAIAGLLAACEPAVNKTITAGAGADPQILAASDIDAGRYMVLVGGCNDCHTPQYAMTNGARPPEAEWLRGSTEGHPGPWGVSYGKNLRMTVARMTEDQWVELLNTGTSMPPMPWPSVRAMSDADKRAVYRYIKSLPGEVGEQSPPSVPAGAAPAPPPAPAAPAA